MVFFTSIIGIAVFLFVLSTLSICGIKPKFNMKDKKSSSLTDVLSKYYWNSLLLLCSSNNLLVPIYLLGTQKQIGNQKLALIINTVAGGIQIIFLLLLQCISIFPILKTPETLYIVKQRAIIFLALNLTGFIILPLAGLITAVISKDTTNVCFLWNIVAFFNNLFLNWKI